MSAKRIFELPDGEQIDELVEALIPKRGDPTFAVLKAHLLIEDYLTEYIETKVRHANYLQQARLTFAQKASLARAFNARANDDWIWDGIRKLSELRNELAHRRKSAKVEGKVREFREHVDRANFPKWPAERVLKGEEARAWLEAPISDSYEFADLDVALMVLCSVVALALGLDHKGVLPPMMD